MSLSGKINSFVGKSAADAYRDLILLHEGIKKFSVCEYESPPSLQQRIKVTEFEEAIIKDALVIRAASKIPFWEAIFSACIKRGECSDSLLEATFFHNGQGRRFDYGRQDLEKNILSSLTNGNVSNISLCSEVFDARGKSHHFMFLDFHCEVSADNNKIVHSVCRELMPEGFLILDSGDSYHATSISLISSEDRVCTLGKAILTSPIVDSIYIAHQLQQNSSSIRISKGGKAKKYPMVIDAWKRASYSP